MDNAKILNKRVDENIDENQKSSDIVFQGIAFYLQDNIYCLDVMSIQDIHIARRIYKVPNTNEKLLGVLNLRGNILPVYSLKLIMGLEDEYKGAAKIDDEDKYIVMIKIDKDVFGLLIDGIYRNISGTSQNYREGAHIQKWSKNFLFKGVMIHGDKEILVVNIDNLLKYMISLK